MWILHLRTFGREACPSGLKAVRQVQAPYPTLGILLHTAHLINVGSLAGRLNLIFESAPCRCRESL